MDTAGTGNEAANRFESAMSGDVGFRSARTDDPEHDGGETEPLIAHDGGEAEPLIATSSIHHHESVFSLVVFAPPLSRLHHGHYWTLPVFISCALFVILVVCQLGLTLIAGRYISSVNADFKGSLIRPMDYGIDENDGLTPVQAIYEAAMSTLNKEGGNSTRECCNGADCAALHLPCCDWSDGGASSASREKNTSVFLKAFRANAAEHSKAANFGRSPNEICHLRQDGMLDCSSSSFIYVDAWDELDANGDGLWSYEEAKADRTNLGCRSGVSAEEVFRSACRGIEKDAVDTSDNSYSIPIVPADIEHRKAISKKYFDWWKALAVLCVTPDPMQCSRLVQRGIFDGAIGMARSTGVTRGGISDLDTALDFCQRMLSKNGICEKTLPGSYTMYRSRVMDKCGSPSFTTAGKYLNPHDDKDVMIITTVDYSNYGTYHMVSSWQFIFFLYLILMVWYVGIILEFRSILQLVDFTYNFKVNNHSPMLTPHMQDWVRTNLTGSFAEIGAWLLPEDESTASVEFKGDSMHRASSMSVIDEKHHYKLMVIGSHSRSHRYVCIFMCSVRFFLWIYLAEVGTTFIICNHDYLDLLMNAVALAFIFKLPEFLYIMLVGDHLKEQLEDARSDVYPSSLSRYGCARFLHSPVAWAFLTIPVIAGIVVYYNFYFNTTRFLDALQCACYQEGPSCTITPSFKKTWWDQYWKDTAALAVHRSSWLEG